MSIDAHVKWATHTGRRKGAGMTDGQADAIEESATEIALRVEKWRHYCAKGNEREQQKQLRAISDEIAKMQTILQEL